ncbi:MAG TPA: glycosyltransferase family 87 protein [Anaerolineales bacterium]|nr:glycosyltransferase family 87 protein [Anaerolineales bacterium]
MQTSGIRRVFVIAGIVSLFVSYLGIWIRFINDPVERTGSDFIAFFSAGRVAQNEGTAHVYDLNLQQEIQEHEVGFALVPGQVLLYNHLPFLIPILQAIVGPNYVTSFYLWVFLLISLYATGLLFLSRSLKDKEFASRDIRLAGVGSLLFLPLFFSLINGQDTALLFLGAAIWVYGLLSGKEMLAGFGLGLTTVRPHISIILALPMLFRYRKTFVGFVLGAGGLALLSILILGMEGTTEFINLIRISASGEWYGMKENAMFNLIGLLTRMLPGLGATVIRTIGWIVYGVTIIALCIFWARSTGLKCGKIGLTITLALFAVPHLHFHDLTLLLIPVYELIRSSTENARFKTSMATILPIAISLLLLLGNISPLLQYTFPYLIMLALAGYPYCPKHEVPIS